MTPVPKLNSSITESQSPPRASPEKEPPKLQPADLSAGLELSRVLSLVVGRCAFTRLVL